MIRKIIPQLPARDISETQIFYRNKMRCDVFSYGYALNVKLGGLEIDFFLRDDPLNFIPGSLLLLEDNLSDLYARYSSFHLIEPGKGLIKNASGKMEFQVRDNNGNVLRFAAA